MYVAVSIKCFYYIIYRDVGVSVLLFWKFSIVRLLENTVRNFVTLLLFCYMNVLLLYDCMKNFLFQFLLFKMVEHVSVVLMQKILTRGMASRKLVKEGEVDHLQTVFTSHLTMVGL